MAMSYDAPKATVFAEHFPEDQLTVATFIWPQANPVDTYTIAPNADLSLELDKCIPIRLARLVLYDNANPETIDVISLVASRDLADALSPGSKAADFMLALSIDTPNRIALAKLQATSPSTPPLLRYACILMLNANNIPRDT